MSKNKIKFDDIQKDHDNMMIEQKLLIFMDIIGKILILLELITFGVCAYKRYYPIEYFIFVGLVLLYFILYHKVNNIIDNRNLKRMKRLYEYMYNQNLNVPTANKWEMLPGDYDGDQIEKD